MKQFEVTMQPELYRRQHRLWLYKNWEKNHQATRRLWYISAILLLAGIAVASAKNGETGYLFILMALFTAYAAFISMSIYRRSKKSFEKAVNERITDWEKHRQNTLVEYDEESIRMVGPTADIKLKWESFKSYFVIEQTLYLISDIGTAFIIAESLAGPENYAELIRIIGSKTAQS